MSDLEKRSVMMSMVIWLSDSGRSVRKCNAICDHGLFGIGKDNNLPVGRLHSTWLWLK